MGVAIVPTYEYACKSCDHRFEALQAMKDDPLEICPECTGPVKRLISGGAGLIFKGSGFYITDYRKGSYSTDKTQAESSSSSTGTKAPSCGPEKCGTPECPAE